MTASDRRLDVIQIYEDEQGPHLIVRVQIGESERTIRWGVDTFTYGQLQICLQRHASALQADVIGAPTLRLTFDCGWSQHSHAFVCRATVVSDNGAVDDLFLCSELFSANLNWLESISSIDQLGEDAQTRSPAEKMHGRRDGRRWPVFGGGVATIAVCGVLALTLRHWVPLWTQFTSGTAMPLRPGTSRSLSGHAPTHNTKTPPASAARPPLASVSNNIGSVSSSAKPDVDTSNETTTGKLQPDRAKVIWGVPDGEVALTFDDGPSPYTAQFVKVLQKYGVHATFFFVGNRIHLWPQSVLDVAQAGDEIGDHSWSHPVLPHLSKISQSMQILKTRETIQKLIGKPVTLFRPPYGDHSHVTDQIVFGAGMSLAMWNRDPRDWAAKSPQQIIHNVFAVNPSGGVYDMHENKNTLAALPTIISMLEARHLQLVMLPEK